MLCINGNDDWDNVVLIDAHVTKFTPLSILGRLIDVNPNITIKEQSFAEQVHIQDKYAESNILNAKP